MYALTSGPLYQVSIGPVWVRLNLHTMSITVSFCRALRLRCEHSKSSSNRYHSLQSVENISSTAACVWYTTASRLAEMHGAGSL